MLAKSEHLRRQAMRQCLSAFVPFVFSRVAPGRKYYSSWHIGYVCEHLEAVERGEIRRLLINEPPRKMKSITCSVAFPAWAMGRNPSLQFMAASYSAPLAIQHNVDTRLVMQDEYYKVLFPAVELSGDQNEKGRFTTTKRGHRIATSVGASSTGMGGDILLVDDSLKAEDAFSDVARSNCWRWFGNTYITRLNNQTTGAIVVVEQRLHEDDLTGHLEREGEWTHIKIPLVAEGPQVYSYGRVTHEREEGDILMPETTGPAEVEVLRRNEYMFAAQYQQEPHPLGGGIIKMEWLLRYYPNTLPPVMDYVTLSWDTAFKAGIDNDYSVCTIWGKKDNRHYLLDMVRGRWEYPELKRRAVELWKQWGANAVLVEDKASGQSLIQDFMVDTGMPVIAVKVDADKVTRTYAVTPMIEGGRVYIPEQGHYLSAMLHELASFPSGRHDDIVDSFTQYLNWDRRRSISEDGMIYGTDAMAAEYQGII